MLWRQRKRVSEGRIIATKSLTQERLDLVDYSGDVLDRDWLLTTDSVISTKVFIFWTSVFTECVILNSNNFVIFEIGQTATGGLIRNIKGHCLAAFVENLGKCSIPRAELRALCLACSCLGT
ncbi:hypothetical protein LINPERPRIM_LOCUS39129 [Linum perenne]